MVNYKPHLRTRVVNAPNFGKLPLLPMHDGVPSLHFSLGGLSNVVLLTECISFRNAVIVHKLGCLCCGVRMAVWLQRL